MTGGENGMDRERERVIDTRRKTVRWNGKEEESEGVGKTSGNRQTGLGRMSQEGGCRESETVSLAWCLSSSSSRQC